MDYFSILSLNEVVQGRINPATCKEIFAEAKKNTFHDENETKKKLLVNVIICAKTIKTIFEANEKVQDEIDELTGIYYIPATLNEEGLLLFDEGEKKLPWFPREYLMPMVEPKLAIGNADAVDSFMSNHVDRVEKIKSWSDYAVFFKGLYEAVAESPFEQNTIRNMDEKKPFFELESNVYLFGDKTVYSTFHIMNLYNHLLEDDQPIALYENFISMQMANTSPLIENGYTNICPKCQSNEIIRIPGKIGAYGSGNNIPVGYTVLSSVTVTRYLCTSCGYTEEWINNSMDIETLKKHYSKRK